MAISFVLTRLRRHKAPAGAGQPAEPIAAPPVGHRTRGPQRQPRKFPVAPLLLGVLLTMAMGAFVTWNTWITYRGFQDTARVELPLDRLSGTIVHLDEVLTMSARMCAVTGEQTWEARYRSFEPKLDDAIKETIALSPTDPVRQAAMRLDIANIRLVDMEHASFDLVRAGRTAEARSLLFSREYEEQKGIYAEAIAVCKRAVARRVDEELQRHARRAFIGLALTLAALLTLGVGWARVIRLVRQSFADRLVLQGRLEDAVRARDEFLSIASHELKTPLTTLKLQLQSFGMTMRRELGPQESPKLERKLELTERQVGRLSSLIDELLDTSRITSGRMILTLDDDVDLSDVIAEGVARFKNELIRAGCELRVSGIDMPILGRWDRIRLDQVLSNLISNALKYGAGQPVEIAVDADERLVSLTVRDHGIGISPDKHETIFQRFERAVPEREYGGFGLGLWIVKEIASAMGGSVSVTSQLGEGATFRVVLPRTVTSGFENNRSS